MELGRKESFDTAVSLTENVPEVLTSAFEYAVTKEFWTDLKPHEQHTEKDYEVFLSQIQNCRLPLEITNTLKAWDIDIPEDWQQTIDQASLDVDGTPDVSAMMRLLPGVGLRLFEIYEETLELKKQVKQNTFVFNSDNNAGPFGACETRLLPAPNKKPDANPMLVMPGCLTGAISLENTAVAVAQSGYDVVSCDTSAPKWLSPHGSRKYHKNNDTKDWSTPRTAVNTAYTKSVEYAMKTYEEGLNMPADQKYNLLGYSTSAAAVLQAALLNPEKVDKILLLAPIGTTNTNETFVGNVLKILINAAKHSYQNVKLGEKTQNAREYFTGYIDRQKIRGWSEVPRIIGNAALTDLTEAIYQVVVEKGIPVGVILGDEDELFPVKDSVPMLETVDEKLGDATADTPFEVVELDGGYTHNHIGRDPDRTALVLEGALTALGRTTKYDKTLAGTP